MSTSPSIRTGRARLDAAPDFCLPASAGSIVCLHDFIARGPVLVWFYRGHWCAHCRTALAQLRDAYAALSERGVEIVAVYPDPPSESRTLVADLDLPFVVLADEEHRVSASFGAVSAGDVLPSAFLVDRRGRIQWAHVGGDQVDQPSPDAALAVLRGGTPLAIQAPSSVLTPAVATAVGIGFALLAVLAAVANLRLLSWDEPARDAIRGFDGEAFGSLMGQATRLGSRWVIAAVTLPMAAVVWRRCRQLAVVLVGAFFASLSLELVLKAVVDRPRPPGASGFGNSFPSGHVMAAVAFWGLVPPWAYVMSRRRWVWALSAVVAGAVVVVVGASRVYLGHHWPSDVVGGLLGGAVFLLAAEWTIRRPPAALPCDACDLHPLRPQREGRAGDVGSGRSRTT